jgi:DNA-binding response OmpR family regulator
LKNYEVLLVDDDPNILKVIASALGDRGYQVTTASGGDAAIEALRINEFDLVITDLNMPETDGIAVVKKAKELNRDRGVMILTGSCAPTLVAQALRVGADDYMLKPCKLSDLWRRVDKCLERSEVKPMKNKTFGTK